jgi:hypothetical protein
MLWRRSRSRVIRRRHRNHVCVVPTLLCRPPRRSSGRVSTWEGSTRFTGSGRSRRRSRPPLQPAKSSVRPRDHDDEAVARLLATVLQSRPSVGTHWTRRGRRHRDLEEHGAALSRLFGVQRTAPGPSSSRPTRCSSRRCATSSGSTSIRRITRSCCASMRKARFGRSSACNRFCRWGLATSMVPPPSRQPTSHSRSAAFFDVSATRPCFSPSNSCPSPSPLPARRVDAAGLQAMCDMGHRHDQDLAIEPNLAMSAATDATSST